MAASTAPARTAFRLAMAHSRSSLETGRTTADRGVCTGSPTAAQIVGSLGAVALQPAVVVPRTLVFVAANHTEECSAQERKGELSGPAKLPMVECSARVQG